MKLAPWNVQGAQGTLGLRQWANILQLIHDRRRDMVGIREYNPGFAEPEVRPYRATISATMPQELGHTWSPWSPRPRDHILPARDGRGTDHRACLLQIYTQGQNRGGSIYLIHGHHHGGGQRRHMGFPPIPTMARRPGQPNPVGPVVVHILPTKEGQYYTRIPRHARRLDAILVRQQIPNIPWTYYGVIPMPISDHSLVLVDVRWRTRVTLPPAHHLSQRLPTSRPPWPTSPPTK